MAPSSTPNQGRVIDPWVNVRLAGHGWQKQVASGLFKRTDEEVFRNYEPAEMLALMDPLGIERVVLGLNGDAPEKEILAFVTKHPERFSLGVHVDPRRGLKATRAVDALAKNHPVSLVRLMPCLFNLPPDDRTYYPLYAKAAELKLPVAITTGIPGPALPGRCQDPIHLDDVCLFFPELTVVMANGADPWWSVAIRLLQKYERLFLMTSAWAPKYLPAELLTFMNGRGQDKILFATDFPFLAFDRCLGDAASLDLSDEVRDKYLYANAARILFPSPVAEPLR